MELDQQQEQLVVEVPEEDLRLDEHDLQARLSTNLAVHHLEAIHQTKEERGLVAVTTINNEDNNNNCSNNNIPFTGRL